MTMRFASSARSASTTAVVAEITGRPVCRSSASSMHDVVVGAADEAAAVQANA